MRSIPPSPSVQSGTSPPSRQLSFTDAAEQVLEQFAERRPMHYTEITRRALERGLISTQGKTPEATMRAQIAVEIQRQQQRGEIPRFTRYPKGRIGLTRWNQRDKLTATIDQHNRSVHEALHASLMKLSPIDFEKLIGLLLTRIGFDRVSVTPPSNDGGIDVRGTLVVGDVIVTRMAIQVKRCSRNIDRTVVQKLRGSLRPYEQAMIITTSDFTSSAREEATRPDAVPVALMSGKELVSLLMEHEIGARRQKRDVFTLCDLNEELRSDEEEADEILLETSPGGLRSIPPSRHP